MRTNRPAQADSGTIAIGPARPDGHGAGRDQAAGKKPRPSGYTAPPKNRKHDQHESWIIEQLSPPLARSFSSVARELSEKLDCKTNQSELSRWFKARMRRIDQRNRLVAPVRFPETSLTASARRAGDFPAGSRDIAPESEPSPKRSAPVARRPVTPFGSESPAPASSANPSSPNPTLPLPTGGEAGAREEDVPRSGAENEGASSAKASHSKKPTGTNPPLVEPVNPEAGKGWGDLLDSAAQERAISSALPGGRKPAGGTEWPSFNQPEKFSHEEQQA